MAEEENTEEEVKTEESEEVKDQYHVSIRKPLGKVIPGEMLRMMRFMSTTCMEIGFSTMLPMLFWKELSPMRMTD